MEFSEVSVKESPGLCRCCLSEGCYKDLGTEYIWMNETEVYADMLLDCFDIGITQHNDGPNGPKRLICEVCITRLRDACNFKKQVLDSERRFIDMLGRGDFKNKVVVYETPMKSERVEVIEDLDNSAEVEYLDEFDINNDDTEIEVEPIKAEEPSTSDASPRKRGRPKKDNDPPAKKAKKDLKYKTKTSKGENGYKSAPMAAMSHQSTISATKRNRLMKHNAVLILDSSNAIPFKWHLQNYLCFYCHLNLNSMNEVKEHLSCNHTNSSKKSAVFCLKRDEKVKIEITDLQCKLCGQNYEVFATFVQHLKNVHDLEFNEGDYGVLPYKIEHKLNRYQCGVCNEIFEYFVKLNQHMNKHFGSYVCELCGKAYLSAVRLRCHANQHEKNFPCTTCNEIFPSKSSRWTHEEKIHNKLRSLKCNHCSETFNTYKLRKLHHNSAHGIAMAQFECPTCSKVYHQMSKMKAHLQEVHEKVKNHSCSVCGLHFYQRRRYDKHIARHGNDKK